MSSDQHAQASDNAMVVQAARDAFVHLHPTPSTTQAWLAARRQSAELLRSEHESDRLLCLLPVDDFAQEHPGYRQAVVDLCCGMLRLTDGPDPLSDAVRREVQRVLSARLRPGGTSDAGDDRFWPGMVVDLTGAVVVDGDFSGCRVRRASFDSVVFRGPVTFAGACFAERAGFTKAEFTGPGVFRTADFRSAVFEGEADFTGARFRHAPLFKHTHFRDRCNFGDYRGGGARFDGDAAFLGARFDGHTTFAGVDFIGKGWFDDSRFNGVVAFKDAVFSDSALFADVQFNAYAAFKGVRFDGLAGFRGARFAERASFIGSRFADLAIFEHDRFDGDVDFGYAQVRRDRNPVAWPRGWGVVPVDEEWGELWRRPVFEVGRRPPGSPITGVS